MLLSGEFSSKDASAAGAYIGAKYQYLMEHNFRQ